MQVPERSRARDLCGQGVIPRRADGRTRGRVVAHGRPRPTPRRRRPALARRAGPRRRRPLLGGRDARPRAARRSPTPNSAARSARSPAGWRRWASTTGDKVAILCGTVPEWPMADFGVVLRRRDRRARLPHELARGVRVRALALGREGDPARGRRAGGEDRHGARHAARARARGRADRRGRGRDHAGRPARARRRRRRDDRRASGPPPSTPTTRRRSSTPPAPPARPRAACSRTRTCSTPRQRVHRPPEHARLAAGDLPVPAARARAGADGLLRRAGHRRHARVLGRRHEEPRQGHRRGRSRRTSRPSRGCWRRSTRAWSAPRPPPAAPRPRSSRARWRPARRWPRPSARAARSARSTAPATPSATSSRCSKVRDALGPNDPVLITGAAPIGTEVIEFFYACGVPGARGLRDDRDVRRGDAEHASTRSASAASGARCPGPRSRSATTARS